MDLPRPLSGNLIRSEKRNQRAELVKAMRESNKKVKFTRAGSVNLEMSDLHHLGQNDEASY